VVLLLVSVAGARAQTIHVGRIQTFTLDSLTGNGTRWVPVTGGDGYVFSGWCRIWNDPCDVLVRLENSFVAYFHNASSPGQPEHGVPPNYTMYDVKMSGHAHVGTCDNPMGHWKKDKELDTGSPSLNEMWMGMPANSSHGVAEYPGKVISATDKPLSFVYHNTDGSMFACCEYDFFGGFPRCTSGALRAGGGVLGAALAGLLTALLVR